MIDKKKQQNTKLAVLSNFSDENARPKGDPKVVCHPGPCWSFEPQPDPTIYGWRIWQFRAWVF